MLEMVKYILKDCIRVTIFSILNFGFSLTFAIATYIMYCLFVSVDTILFFRNFSPHNLIFFVHYEMHLIEITVEAFIKFSIVSIKKQN